MKDTKNLTRGEFLTLLASPFLLPLLPGKSEAKEPENPLKNTFTQEYLSGYNDPTYTGQSPAWIKCMEKHKREIEKEALFGGVYIAKDEINGRIYQTTFKDTQIISSHPVPRQNGFRSKGVKLIGRAYEEGKGTP